MLELKNQLAMSLQRAWNEEQELKLASVVLFWALCTMTVSVPHMSYELQSRVKQGDYLTGLQHL